MLHPFESKRMFEDQKYSELIELGNNKDNRAEFTERDWRYYLQSLYKQQRYKEFLDKYKEAYKQHPNIEGVDWNLCWALYYTYIRDFDFKKGDINLYRRQITLILDKLQNDKGNVLPKTIVFQFCKAIKEGFVGESRDFSLIESYLKRINPDNLTKEEQMNTNPKIKTKSFASDYERWYSYMSKALLEQEKYDECIECCDKALDTINKFHSNNDIWFNYRKAKSLREIGREAKGTEIINKTLSSRFSHWCLYEYLFDNAVNSDDGDSASMYGAKCATADKEHKMRVTFYKKYADYLEKHDCVREAMLLHQLIILVRQEEGWREKSYFADWNISNDVRQLRKNDILEELNGYWRKLVDSDKIAGRIKKIICEGGSGFIVDKNGNEYYFNAKDFKAQRSKMVEGQEVKFNLIDGFDKKKNIKTKNATNITL